MKQPQKPHPLPPPQSQPPSQTPTHPPIANPTGTAFTVLDTATEIAFATLSSLTEEQAEIAVRAGNTNDIETANQYMCPGQLFEPDERFESVVFGEIECKREGDQMTCDYDFTIGETVFRFEQVFEIEDEKLCETLSLNQAQTHIGTVE
jgi:hypothetical protein